MAHTYEFNQKIEKACRKKEELFSENKLRYAIRSLFGGAFLTMSTAAGAVAAQMIASVNPALSKFVFSFIFAWGLVYILFLNAELSTSNMMYLSAGIYQKKIRVGRAVAILLYCTIFNLIGAMIAGWAFVASSAFNGMDLHHFLVHLVEVKATRSSELVLLEAVIANVFVNVAILSFLLIKDETTKLWVVISAVFMFVFLGNEHVVANFASFSMVRFSELANDLDFMNWMNILRHWSVAFVGNIIGGGVVIGIAYAFLNQTKSVYHE